MLAQESTSKEKVFSPFWTELSQEWSQKLWLPTRTDYVDLPLTLLNGCSRNMTQRSWFTTKLKSKQTKQNYNKISSPLSQYLWQEITEKDLQEIEEREKEESLKKPKKKKIKLNKNKSQKQKAPVGKAKKYRVFPNKDQKDTLTCWFGATRWIYNKVVAIFKVRKRVSREKLREHLIYDEIYKTRKPKDKDLYSLINPDGKDTSWMLKIPQAIRDSALSDFLNARSTALNSGKKFKMKYRSKRRDQAFEVQERDFHRKRGVFYELFHNLEFTELIPKVDRAIRVIKNGDAKYYIAVPEILSVRDENQVPKTEDILDGIISCDPGVRTFQTTYSPSGRVTEWGKSDIRRIYRLCHCLDDLQSKYTRSDKQWTKHDFKHKRRYNMKKAAARMRTKIKNLVKELHCKLVKWILSEHRVVLLPKFEVSKMLKKGRRKISSKTARAMATWSHYKFRERLLFKSQEYWCRVVICTEEYTSKTCGRCGWVFKKLGGAKMFSCQECGLKIERDINGARNILIKYLTERGSIPKGGVMNA